jgi:endoribonuclease Dicer
MAALVDLAAPDSPHDPRIHLSKDTLEAMSLLFEKALEGSSVTSSVHITVEERPLDSPLSETFRSTSSIPPFQQLTPGDVLDVAPALTTRTSDAVITDLKSGRQKKYSTPASVGTKLGKLQARDGPSESVIGAHRGENGEGEDDGNGPEEEVFVPSKPRKISERKRAQNAAMNDWFQNLQKQQARAASTTSNGDRESHSVKFLVKQNESQRIISSPREYQVELFERAKAENIIAVLDTGKPHSYSLGSLWLILSQGSGKTLIAVLLLQHILKQELEDRAMGKPKRVAFFLV